jgi:lincosamide nucleotidyltransferase A/C/D/E
MNAVDVVGLYTELENLGITIWIEGGWGIDALLGEETRPHTDLDITVRQVDVSKLRHFLQMRGFKEIKLEKARPWNFVLGDESGREIDVHVIIIDAVGNGLYGPAENGETYPAASLTVKFHSGYELREKDFRDVSALCKRFGIELPEAFAQFKK